ncbi:hypothetical protein HDU87_002074, partial [Geranomyces variabilis]
REAHPALLQAALVGWLHFAPSSDTLPVAVADKRSGIGKTALYGQNQVPAGTSHDFVLVAINIFAVLQFAVALQTNSLTDMQLILLWTPAITMAMKRVLFEAQFPPLVMLYNIGVMAGSGVLLLVLRAPEQAYRRCYFGILAVLSISASHVNAEPLSRRLSVESGNLANVSARRTLIGCRALASLHAVMTGTRFEIGWGDAGMLIPAVVLSCALYTVAWRAVSALLPGDAQSAVYLQATVVLLLSPLFFSFPNVDVERFCFLLPALALALQATVMQKLSQIDGTKYDRRPSTPKRLGWPSLGQVEPTAPAQPHTGKQVSAGNKADLIRKTGDLLTPNPALAAGETLPLYTPACPRLAPLKIHRPTPVCSSVVIPFVNYEDTSNPKMVTMEKAAKKRRLYDVFYFNSEMEMVDIRLMELWDAVDYFVIKEAAFTYTGKVKLLYFDILKPRYAAFMDKIIHIPLANLEEQVGDGQVKAPPSGRGEHWDREYAVRDLLLRKGLHVAAPAVGDIVVVSDLDEIPRAEYLHELKHCSGWESGIAKTPNRACLQPDFFYYNFEYIKNNEPWWHPDLYVYQGPGTIHGSSRWEGHSRNPGIACLHKAAWHCSYCFPTIDSII